MTAPLREDGAGRISRVAIAISEFSAKNFSDAIRNVLRALPKQVALDVMADASTRALLDDWLAEAGKQANATVHLAPDGLNFSLWMQDPLLIRQDGSASVSDAFERYRDRDVALHLRMCAGWPTSQTPVHVDGGNVITHGDLALISADAQADSDALAAFDPSRNVVQIATTAPCEAETSRKTDRPLPDWTEVLHYLNTRGTRQPIFHLDHLIAPAGFHEDRPRFLVGCPRLGAEVIGHPLWPHTQPVAFDEIATLLESNGAEVIRNPQPLAWVDRPEQQFRRWFHLPVNNVLIDEGSVLLPCFANDSWPELRALDDENVALWKRLGFNVIVIPGMMALAEAMGGPRCMVKVTERG